MSCDHNWTLALLGVAVTLSVLGLFVFYQGWALVRERRRACDAAILAHKQKRDLDRFLTRAKKEDR